MHNLKMFNNIENTGENTFGLQAESMLTKKGGGLTESISASMNYGYFQEEDPGATGAASTTQIISVLPVKTEM